MLNVRDDFDVSVRHFKEKWVCGICNDTKRRSILSDNKNEWMGLVKAGCFLGISKGICVPGDPLGVIETEIPCLLSSAIAMRAFFKLDLNSKLVMFVAKLRAN